MAMTMGSFASRVVATKVVATDGTGDYTNIQDAIDSLPANGGCIYVKEGIYVITAAITILKSNVSIIGCGGATIIRATPAFNGTMLVMGNDLGSYNNIFLAQFKLDGNKTNGAVVARAIHFNRNIDDTTITNVWIDDVSGIGIEIYRNSNYDIITECIICNCTGDGIYIWRTSGANQITNTQCRINSNGIHIDAGCDNTMIAQCRCSDNTLNGINVDANYNFIEGCILFSNNSDGIFLDTADKCIIIGCKCWGNAQNGIQMNIGSDRNLVISNQVYGNTAAQIIDNGAFNDVSHNQIV